LSSFLERKKFLKVNEIQRSKVNTKEQLAITPGLNFFRGKKKGRRIYQKVKIKILRIFFLFFMWRVMMLI